MPSDAAGGEQGDPGPELLEALDTTPPGVPTTLAQAPSEEAGEPAAAETRSERDDAASG